MTGAPPLDLREWILARGYLDELVIDRGVLGDAPAVFGDRLGAVSILLIADDNTYAAAGARLRAGCEAASLQVETMILPGTPRLKPDIAIGRRIADRIGGGSALPVVVGSGVLNDLTKYAAAISGRPYASVPTAASMDGYAAGGAPLLQDGFKQTVPCRGPRAVMADLDVLAAAPARMSSWGFCDLAAKVPAGADWILADALGVEAIDPMAWRIMQGDLRAWIGRPEAIAQGDPDAFGGLIAGLLAGGFAMLAYGSSRPASGAEHQIGHLWEMENLAVAGEPVSHGICVGIGSLAVLALYEWLLDCDLDKLDVDALVDARPTRKQREAAVADAFPPGTVRDRALAETLAKHDSEAACRGRLDRLRGGWLQLRDRLQAQLLPARRMATLIEAAGGVADPEVLGIGPARLRDSILRARLIRRRYTVLDLVEETGLLREAVEVLFPDH